MVQWKSPLKGAMSCQDEDNADLKRPSLRQMKANSIRQATSESDTLSVSPREEEATEHLGVGKMAEILFLQTHPKLANRPQGSPTQRLLKIWLCASCQESLSGVAVFRGCDLMPTDKPHNGEILPYGKLNRKSEPKPHMPRTTSLLKRGTLDASRRSSKFPRLGNFTNLH